MPENEFKIISTILAKYPVVEEEEEKILREWIDVGRNREIFESLTNDETKIELLERLDQMKQEEDEKWMKFLPIIGSVPHRGKVFWWGRWQTYLAAASIIGLILIGFKWFGGKNKTVENSTPVVVKSNDVSPGKFKAKLTLADGSVVVLDSFSNRLVQQGSTNVYTKDGELVYDPKGARRTEVLYNTLTTAKGEIYATVLSDGSKIWLNSQSSIRYPVVFTADARKVEITGEAGFEIASSEASIGKGKKIKMPFIVTVNGMDVEVLGTHFNVNAYNDETEIKTTLLEGKVKVNKGSYQTLLSPGQQAKLNKQTQTLEKLSNVDVEEAVAWRYGYFQFNGADLQTVLRQLARWYNVDVVYQGNIPQRSFGGRISRKNSLSQVLEILKSNNVHFRIDRNKIVVSPE